jgi:hypothetical protein
VLGTELLATGLLVWSIQIGIHLQALRRRVGPSPAARIGRIGFAQAAVLPFPVAGVSLLLGAGGGLYWLVPGVVLCLVVAVLGRMGAAHRDPAVTAAPNRQSSVRS